MLRLKQNKIIRSGTVIRKKTFVFENCNFLELEELGRCVLIVLSSGGRHQNVDKKVQNFSLITDERCRLAF